MIENTLRRLAFFGMLCMAALPLLPRPVVAETATAKDYVDYVRPWIGSKTGRWFQTVSACRPFGLVGLVPDTAIQSRWGGSGYVYEKTNVFGFAHLHGWALGAILVMPTQDGVQPARGPEGWQSGHQHTNEIMTAGYHQVRLDRYGITAEITSTVRAGLHRWTFARPGPADIMFDLGSELCEARQTDASVARSGDRELAGWVYLKAGFEGETGDVGKVYFVARFSRPFDAVRAWNGRDLGVVDAASGHPLVVYPRFAVQAGEVLTMSLGVSFCSVEQARKNLELEVGSKSFDTVRAESRTEWNDWLGRVQVTGGTEQQRIKFYTDVWHSLFGRQTLNDADGTYLDRLSGQVRHLPLQDGRPVGRVFNSDSLWWSMWNLNLWWGLAYPEILEQWAQDSLLWYDNDPKHRIPWGNVNGAHSWIMMGCQRTPLLCRAVQLGLKGVDAQKAYQALKQMHSAPRVGGNGWMDGLAEYAALGYISTDCKIIDQCRSASLTCDDAYTDWVLAQLALKLGATNDAAFFLRRSANWTNLWDGHFIRPRHRDGTWADFNPLVGRNQGFCEANAEQYSFFSVQDVPGMARLMGGFDALADRLDADFRQAEPARFAFAEGQFGGEGPVNYANEPNMQAAYLFNYAGRPWRSQYWVRRVRELAYGDIDPTWGYARGDEDQGMMGALSALMAVGLFSVRGGCETPPIYEITTPLFDTITFQLDARYYPAKQFVIKTHHNAPQNHYIQSARLGGKPLRNCWFLQRDFAAGKTLELWLGPRPNPHWGVAVPPWKAGSQEAPPR